jgi:hypothetical protein
MVLRAAVVTTVLLLLCGLLAAGPGDAPVRAQDDDYEWPEIGTIQVPGEIQVPGTIATAGDIADVPGSIQVVGSFTGNTTLATDIGIELILDNSGSMLSALGSERRIDIAKRVMDELVRETLPSGIPMALRVFGNQPDSCETGLAISLQPLDRQAAVSEIAAIESIDGVKTPIGAALEQVAADLAGVAGPKIVVLVTDGEETCGGNPRRAIRNLVGQGIDVRVNVVGFAVDDEGLKKEFEEWASIGGGQFFDASNAEELGDAIAAALQPPYEVIDAAGAVVGQGVVGGPPVRVPPGVYVVEVRSEPPLVVEDVTVENADEIVVDLAASS